jgi:hypothetical protein
MDCGFRIVDFGMYRRLLFLEEIVKVIAECGL